MYMYVYVCAYACVCLEALKEVYLGVASHIQRLRRCHTHTTCSRTVMRQDHRLNATQRAGSNVGMGLYTLWGITMAVAVWVCGCVGTDNGWHGVAGQGRAGQGRAGQVWQGRLGEGEDASHQGDEEVGGAV